MTQSSYLVSFLDKEARDDALQSIAAFPGVIRIRPYKSRGMSHMARIFFDDENEIAIAEFIGTMPQTHYVDRAEIPCILLASEEVSFTLDFGGRLSPPGVSQLLH